MAKVNYCIVRCFVLVLNINKNSPLPLRSLYLGRSLVSAQPSLLLLWHGEFSSFSSKSSSDTGDVVDDTSSWLLTAQPLDHFPSSSLLFCSSVCDLSPSFGFSPVVLPSSGTGPAWFVGLEGFEGLQLPSEPRRELGLECSEREGVSGSLIVVHGAPYGSCTNPTNLTPWSAASWICCYRAKTTTHDF